MSLGPIEVLMLRFPGNKFRGEIAPALADLVESGTIRVVDLLFAIKDADGELDVLELKDMEGDLSVFAPMTSELADTLTEEDAQMLARSIPNNSSAAILLFENTWAKSFVDAVVRANGEVVLNERIPRAAVDALIAEVAAAKQSIDAGEQVGTPA
jgi:Family of unknown function (DUF6325)